MQGKIQRSPVGSCRAA